MANFEASECQGQKERWVPNPPFANPRVAEKGPWRSLQSGVAEVYSVLEIPTDSYHLHAHLTPLSDTNSHFARKALSATPGLAPGGSGARRRNQNAENCSTVEKTRRLTVFLAGAGGEFKFEGSFLLRWPRAVAYFTA